MATTVEYKGKTIVTVPSGGKIVLTTKDFLMEDDLTLVTNGGAEYFSVSVGTTGWTKDDNANWYTKTINVTGILATDQPDVDVDLTSAETSDEIEAMLVAWGNIFRITTANGSVTVYSSQEPETAITITLRCIR